MSHAYLNLYLIIHQTFPSIYKIKGAIYKFIKPMRAAHKSSLAHDQLLTQHIVLAKKKKLAKYFFLFFFHPCKNIWGNISRLFISFHFEGNPKPNKRNFEHNIKPSNSII